MAFARKRRRLKIARAETGYGENPHPSFAGAPPRASRAPSKSNASAPRGRKLCGALSYVELMGTMSVFLRVSGDSALFHST